MRCLTCKYDLSNLNERRCPECGRAFDPADASTFHTDTSQPASLDNVRNVAVVCYLLNLCFAAYLVLKYSQGSLGEILIVPLVALFLLPITFVPGIIIYGIYWIIRTELGRRT